MSLLFSINIFCTESLTSFFSFISGSFLKINQIVKKQDQKIRRNLTTILGLTSIFIKMAKKNLTDSQVDCLSSQNIKLNCICQTIFFKSLILLSFFLINKILLMPIETIAYKINLPKALKCQTNLLLILLKNNIFC